MGCCQTQDSDDDEDLSVTIAQIRRFSIKKCSGGEVVLNRLVRRVGLRWITMIWAFIRSLVR